MAPSQLKQLKASLRDSGVVGPQQSKKQKKQTSKDADKRLQRKAALEGIRERFNPFELKQSARGPKFEVTSNKPVKKTGPGRPGVTKGLGEEKRRATLLKEIQSRSKVGGILDRRFGENDPTMTPEQRAAERFARQSEKKLKKSSMFNLEEDEEEDEMQLTHAGRSLSLGNGNPHDDFQEGSFGGSDEDSDQENEDLPRKRRRLSHEEEILEEGADGVEADDNGPDRRKSKQEVMKEVIAKSKFYKYERQQAKEDDDDLRAELDKGLPEFYEAMRNHRVPTKKPLVLNEGKADLLMNPDRAALLAGKDRLDADKEYNERVRQLAMDVRSKPADRTKPEEEKIAEEAERLKELERKRLQRMKGEPDSSDEDPVAIQAEEDDDEEQDDAQAFGFGQELSNGHAAPELDVEDEDDFILDDNLIASDSEADVASEDSDAESDELSNATESDGGNDLINGPALPGGRPSHDGETPMDGMSPTSSSSGNLAFTYPCPQSHEELLDITKSSNNNDLPTIVQRIRALYHPKLAVGNKSKLEQFSKVLTEHVVYLAGQEEPCSAAILETLIRHLHSLAKSFPEAVGDAFRAHLSRVSSERPLKLRTEDMVILTGISTIFPTSDHFHSVVTPANLVLARYLGQSSVQTLGDLAIGAYCCTLALQYQKLSKRYIPECMTYLVKAFSTLSPIALEDTTMTVPIRLPNQPLRLDAGVVHIAGPMTLKDVYAGIDNENLKSRLLQTFLKLIGEAADLWQAKSSFNEIFQPALMLLHLLQKASAIKKSIQLDDYLQGAIVLTARKLEGICTTKLDSRRPLLLHNHRPLAIKTSIPKFEESYNPDRHYDPDRERSDLNKLKAEHKRERKGAMRELRKDANFIAREGLREKKEKDAAYEKKYKRLVAEIQGEEGKEAKEYEREKRKRKGKF